MQDHISEHESNAQFSSTNSAFSQLYPPPSGEKRNEARSLEGEIPLKACPEHVQIHRIVKIEQVKDLNPRLLKKIKKNKNRTQLAGGAHPVKWEQGARVA